MKRLRLGLSPYKVLWLKTAIALCMAISCAVMPARERSVKPPRSQAKITPYKIYEELVEADKQTKIEHEALMALKDKLEPNVYYKLALAGSTSGSKAMELKHRLISMADEGDTRAQYIFGAYLYNSVINDYKASDNSMVGFRTAEEYLRKAVAKKYAPAMCVLGTMASSGNGLPKSDLVAIEWHSKCANRSIATDDRDQALLCLDHIKQIDPSHPYYRQLIRKLYP